MTSNLQRECIKASIKRNFPNNPIAQDTAAAVEKIGKISNEDINFNVEEKKEDGL